MFPAEGTDDIDDLVHVAQMQFLHLGIQFVKVQLDGFGVKMVEFAVVTKEHTQNRLSIAIAEVRRMGGSVAS